MPGRSATAATTGRRRILPALVAAGALAGLIGVAAILPADPEESATATAGSAPDLSDGAVEDAGGRGTAEPFPWTSEPVRVDREAQDLERVAGESRPDPFPLLLDIPRGVRIPDSGTFVVAGTTYSVAGVTPRDIRDICTDPEGRRLACGTRARAGLWNLVAEKRLACRIVEDAPDATVVDCSLGPETLSQRLLREGWALPPEEVESALATGERPGTVE